MIKSTGRAVSPEPKNRMRIHHPSQAAIPITYIGKLTVTSNCSSVRVQGTYVDALAAVTKVLTPVEEQVLAVTGNYAYLRPAYEPNRAIDIITSKRSSYLTAVQSLNF